MSKTLPRIDPKPAAQYLDNLSSLRTYLPLHESSGATAANYGTLGATSLTVGGTTTSIWTNRGCITPVGDNYTEVATAGPSLSLAAGQEGQGILVALRATRKVQHSSGLQAIVGCSPVDGRGGFEFGITATGAMLCTIKGNGISATTQTYNIMTIDQEYLYVWWIEKDSGGATVYGYRDGATALTSKSVAAEVLFSNTLPLSFFRRSASSPASDTYVGANSGVHQIHDIFVARCTTAQGANLAAISAAFFKHKSIIPLRQLVGFGV